MEEQTEKTLKDRIKAGRGVVKNENENSKKNTTLNQQDEENNLDDRARKAGY